MNIEYQVNHTPLDAVMVKERADALEWLLARFEKFPSMNKVNHSRPLFNNYRFIKWDDGEVAFTNFSIAAITNSEFKELRLKIDELKKKQSQIQAQDVSSS